jgi:spermidine synthase
MKAGERGARRWADVVFALFFVSGFTSLIYEVIWVRKFGLVFGVTTYAVSTVLAAFFAGLALGSYLAGRLIDRTRLHPLAVYGVMEGVIGVYALLLPALLGLVEGTYPAVYGALWENFSLFTLFRFVVCFAVLVVPTTLMGATLPVLSKLMVEREEVLGLSVGRLYAVNTFGAVAGTFCAGFLLVPALGVTHTTLVAALGNFLLAVVAVLLSKRPALRTVTSTGPQGQPEAAPLPMALADRVILLLAFTSGLAALALEVVWTKSLVLILGSTTYAFSTMLTAVLVGIALGSAVFARYADPTRNRAAVVAFLMFTGGLCAALGPWVIIRLPFAFLRLADWAGGNWTLYIASQFVVCFMLVFVPTFLSGASFPILVRMHSHGMPRVGRTVADIYAVNTVGGILGSLIAGFVLVRFFGLERSLLAAALALMLVGGPLAMTLASGWPRAMRSGIAAVMIAMVIALSVFHPRFDKKLLFGGWGPFSGGYFLSGSGFTTVDITDRYMQRLLYHKEGVSAAVDVLETGYGDKVISINAQTVASTYLYDMRALRMLGHLPVLLHPNPKDALLIGLGAGVSIGIIASYPSVEHVTVAELNEEVPAGTAKFADWNFNAVRNPKVKIVINDGANYVKATRKQYDIISSDPIHPFILGNGILYSSDHWKICKEKLREGGVLEQWVPLYQISDRDFATIVRTFMEVFPNATMWYCGIDALLIGRKGEAKIDVDRMAEHMSDPVMMKDLVSMGVHSPGDVLGWFVAGPQQLREMADQAPINRVEYPVLEYTAPKGLLMSGVAATVPLLLRAVDSVSGLELRQLINDLCTRQLSAQELVDASTVRLANRWIMRAQVLASYSYPADSLHACEQAAGIRPNDRFLTEALSDAEGAVADSDQTDGNSEAAYRSYREAFAHDPHNISALVGAVFAALQLGDLRAAEEELALATPQQREVFQVKVHIGLLALKQSNYEAARAAFEEAADRGQESPTMHVGLGVVDLRDGEELSAYRHFDRALAIATLPLDALYDIVDLSVGHGFASETHPYAQSLVNMSTAAIAGDPGRPNFYEYRALGYSALGDETSAQEDRGLAQSLRGWWEGGSSLSRPASEAGS